MFWRSWGRHCNRSSVVSKWNISIAIRNHGIPRGFAGASTWYHRSYPPEKIRAFLTPTWSWLCFEATPGPKASSCTAGGTGAGSEAPAARAVGHCFRALAFSLCRHLPSPRICFLLLQPILSPLCGLASWALLGACSMFPGEWFPT